MAADSIQGWVDQRVENAKNGHREIIETPFVVRSFGWGCLCPDHYIGINPGMQEGPFLHVKAPKKFPVSSEFGHSLIVTGYFTGAYVEEDFRDEHGEPEEWLYTLPEFVVLEWRVNTLDYDAPSPKILESKEK